MRDVTLDRPRDESVAAAVGRTGGELVELYRLLGIAKYEERYVIPTAYEGADLDAAHQLEELAARSTSRAARDGRQRPVRRGVGRPMPVSSRPSTRCGPGRRATRSPTPAARGARVNLLNWDGKGRPDGLFPPSRDDRIPPGRRARSAPAERGDGS